MMTSALAGYLNGLDASDIGELTPGQQAELDAALNRISQILKEAIEAGNG